jgi:hypothetical protein
MKWTGKISITLATVAEIQTFLDYPPMQRGASFNLDAIKAEMGKRMAEAEAAAKGPSN